jgi:hypothetical protein
MDLTAAGVTDIFVSHSDDRGATWTAPIPAIDQLPQLEDRFNHWLSSDPITGDLNLSFYDTWNDATEFRYKTDTYFSQSNDGGVTFRSPNTRACSVSSNEHDYSGVFPGSAIDYGNQQGITKGSSPMEECLIPSGPTAACKPTPLPRAGQTCRWKRY